MSWRQDGVFVVVDAPRQLSRKELIDLFRSALPGAVDDSWAQGSMLIDSPNDAYLQFFADGLFDDNNVAVMSVDDDSPLPQQVCDRISQATGWACYLED